MGRIHLPISRTFNIAQPELQNFNTTTGELVNSGRVDETQYHRTISMYYVQLKLVQAASEIKWPSTGGGPGNEKLFRNFRRSASGEWYDGLAAVRSIAHAPA
jgi:hypothetical protein